MSICVCHYSNIIMSAIASQITSVLIVCSTNCSAADQRKHGSSASLAFVRQNHRWPVDSPHKRPATGKNFHLMTSSCKCIPITSDGIAMGDYLLCETWAQFAYGAILYHRNMNVIWRHRSSMTLVRVMACCLTAIAHYLNQCCLINETIQSYWCIFVRNALYSERTNMYSEMISLQWGAHFQGSMR